MTRECRPVINLLVLGLTGYLYQAFMADNGTKYNNIGGTSPLTNRDFALADKIRADIEAAGWDVRDDPSGTSLLVPR